MAHRLTARAALMMPSNWPTRDDVAAVLADDRRDTVRQLTGADGSAYYGLGIYLESWRRLGEADPNRI